ncbi:MAG: signal peptidase I [Tissierellaceae bacterium]
MLNNYLPTKRRDIRKLLLIIAIILIYTIENSPIKGYFNSFIFTYLIMPMIWIIVFLILKDTRQIRANIKIRNMKILNFWVFYFGLIYIVVNLLAGLIDGFGKSPYNHTPFGIATNIFLVAANLFGRERVRSVLVRSSSKKDNTIAFIFIAFLMTLVKYPLNRYMSIQTGEGLVQFAAQYFLPDLSNNIFASYLAFNGGAMASIRYLGLIEAFYWLSPVLPNLKWITAAFIGILGPIFFMVLLEEILLFHEGKKSTRRREREGTLSWIATTLISIALIWFAVGVFPIYPSVIATGSMEPFMSPGDIILVRRLTDMEDIKRLKKGDIIQFKKASILISHRIVGIEGSKDKDIKFVTKGDNNKEIDRETVSPENVKGKIKHILPKLGWPTLLIKSSRNVRPEEMGF